MNKLNIHEKVSLLAQTQKNKPKNENNADDDKAIHYENDIKPNLTEEEKKLIEEYLNRLCVLGNYREVDVYYFFKKYDFNLIVIEDVVNVLIKKKEEAMKDNDGWVIVKAPVPRKNSKEEDIKQKQKNDDKIKEDNNKNTETKRTQKAFAKNRQPNTTNNNNNNTKNQENYEYSNKYNYYNNNRYTNNNNNNNNDDYYYYSYSNKYGNNNYNNNSGRYNNNNNHGYTNYYQGYQNYKNKKGYEYDDLERELNELDYITPIHLKNQNNKYKNKGLFKTYMYVKKNEEENQQKQEQEQQEKNEKKYYRNNNTNTDNRRQDNQQNKKFGNKSGNIRQNKGNIEIVYVKKEENDKPNEDITPKNEQTSSNIPIKKHYDEHNIHEFFKETSNQGSPNISEKKKLETIQASPPLEIKTGPTSTIEKSQPQIINEPQAKQVKADTNIPITQTTQKPTLIIQQQPQNIQYSCPSDTTTNNKQSDTNALNNSKTITQDNTNKTVVEIPATLNKPATSTAANINQLNPPINPFSFPQVQVNNQNPSPSKVLPTEIPAPNPNQIKDVPPFLPMPYIVIPQPNGTSIIQPLHQMPYQMPYIMMPPTQFSPTHPQGQINPSAPINNTTKPPNVDNEAYKHFYNIFSQWSFPPESTNDESKKSSTGQKFPQPNPYINYPDRMGPMSIPDPRLYFNFSAQDYVKK